MKQLGLLLFFSGLLFSFSSCKKVEGEGGSSEIVGKVIIRDYDAFGDLIAEYPAQDERVHIIYGTEDNYYDDDYDTSFDGTYRFQFLTKGTYKIFVYQNCNSCPSGDEEVLEVVTIENNNSSVVAPDLIIEK
tara:strand:- start:154211 stop:154606 length:396 start_codon:yes stop_codon:yes gene_type:complete